MNRLPFNLKGTLVPFLLFLALLVFSCKIETAEPVFNAFYEFEIKAQLSNVKSNYQVGDLVWVELSQPDKIFEDISTMQQILVENGRIPLTLGLREISKAQPDSSQATLTLSGGSLVEDRGFAHNGEALLNMGCPSSSYFLKAGIIFQKPGVYVLQLDRKDQPGSFYFHPDYNCGLYDLQPLPRSTNVVTVYYRFDMDETNAEAYKQYIQANNLALNQEIVGDLEAKRAFFLLVE